MNATPPSRAYSRARNLSLAMGVVMLLIGVAVLRELWKITAAPSESVGLVATFYAFMTFVCFVLPGLGYLFFTLFMRPWRLWPMVVVLTLTGLQTLVGAMWLALALLSGQIWDHWFARLWIVFTAAAALLVVLLWTAIRNLMRATRQQAT